ncbi:hypothetical protein [Algoriphagus sp.]|uniref:hypothetical protein n=1 Tax=Algoriphagus sp. TaxID=1872435 RepID=UPI003918B0B1
MKIKSTLIIGTACIAVFACQTNKYTEQDRVTATAALNSFVDSVETAIKVTPSHDWRTIDSRFDSLESRSIKVYSDLKAEKTEIEIIESRYATLIENGKRTEENFEKTAEMHLQNVEKWWATTAKEPTAKRKLTIQNIESTTKGSLDWLDENLNSLGESTRDKYNKMLVEIRKP